MTSAETERGRALRGLMPWAAGLAALAAIGALLWAVLGGTGDRDGERADTPSRSRRIATADAVDAVPLPPGLDPGPVGTPGGPGSVVVAPSTTVVRGEPGAPGAVRRSTRPRRTARPRSPRSDAPTYRAIGPRASEAPSPSPPAAEE